ncbi:SMP-30/gluconolactonase/LRE family protein [Glaciimonas immobilis]|uniref:Sugar lactone lactonase YvrE n=1 Tax=Glaciimonas immobilis TaxID=728004 RepID=A0A840RRC5_9BURK|nr:SMP-30/gluconolactonase/LRE family protein [Glaciimonas immobilis]KAF3999783.1 SMP-30/gluconolactonase/LRE family protein [Glaciimonas immobilis]MBB5200253.1 sugar lactone lactonase YvrE [Glaciimonas immobilis]
MSDFTCVIDNRAKLGECPRWDEINQRLYWVDILAPALHCFSPSTGEHQTLSVAEHIGCFSLADDGGFVAGMRSGIWLLNALGEQVKKLADNPEDQAHSRFNDGRCDRQGRFWAGTLDEPKAGNNAHLYRLDARGLAAVDAGLLTSNGLAFSPDQRWIYHSDTPAFVIYRHPYDADSGAVGTREEWVRFKPTANDRGRPDGAAVDSEGYYWSTLYEGGRVVRISPDGEIVETYRLPVLCPTMCAFGGTDMRTLYVTSASQGRPATELTQYPQSGGVFAMRVEVAGLIEPRFRGDGV